MLWTQGQETFKGFVCFRPQDQDHSTLLHAEGTTFARPSHHALQLCSHTNPNQMAGKAWNSVERLAEKLGALAPTDNCGGRSDGNGTQNNLRGHTDGIGTQTQEDTLMAPALKTSLEAGRLIDGCDLSSPWVVLLTAAPRPPLRSSY